MMDENIYEERLKKSRLDFFGPFHSLFLAFNFWYRNKYGEGFKDFQYIDKIKKDSSSLSLRSCFIDLFESRNIIENLPGLCYMLKDHPIRHKGYDITLNNIILFDIRDIKLDPEDQTPENILAVALGLENSIPEKYKVHEIPDSYKIGDIFVKDDLNLIFSNLIDVIYKIRCAFFHGDLLPDEKNNTIIKHCYFILLGLLESVKWREASGHFQ